MYIYILYIYAWIHIVSQWMLEVTKPNKHFTAGNHPVGDVGNWRLHYLKAGNSRWEKRGIVSLSNVAFSYSWFPGHSSAIEQLAWCVIYIHLWLGWILQLLFRLLKLWSRKSWSYHMSYHLNHHHIQRFDGQRCWFLLEAHLFEYTNSVTPTHTGGTPHSYTSTAISIGVYT